MIENFKMNTCISEIMIFVNHLKSVEYIGMKEWLGFLKVISPFAPFIAEDLWQLANNFKSWNKENSVHLQEWPSYDQGYVETETITIPVQINGKVRAEITINKEDTEDVIKEKALMDNRITKYLNGKECKKVIYVKGKILNLVV